MRQRRRIATQVGATALALLARKQTELGLNTNAIVGLTAAILRKDGEMLQRAVKVVVGDLLLELTETRRRGG